MSGPLDALYATLAEADFSPCQGCTACCEGAWLHEEEATRAEALSPGVVRRERGIAFLGDGGRCPWLGGEACARYRDRPLDCRLFPLDIIQHEGELWWCIFRSCVRPEELGPRLEPFVDRLESLLDDEVLSAFEAQIAVTRDRYPAYASGQYRLLRRLSASPAAPRLSAR